MRPRRGAEAPDDASVFTELEALYREVEARQAGSACPASTECCRFEVTGREPYVTEVELAYLRRAIARRGGKLPQRRPPPLEPPTRARLPVMRDEGVCPLLGPDGRCVVYDARPLGCRTFFCERATLPAPVSQRELNGWVRTVKDLGARLGPRGDEGRPLTRALEGGKQGPGPRR